VKAIFAKTVYIGDKTSLKNAYVVFDNGRISDVTQTKPACEITGEYEAVTPAFIDAHCHIGLDREGEQYVESDVNEHMDPMILDADILDSLQMDDKAFAESVEQGVLYSCIMPGSGNIIGGKTVLIRNFARNAGDAFMKYTGIKAAFGYNPKSTLEWKGDRPSTRMGAVAILRNTLKRGVKTRELLANGKKTLDEIEPSDEIVIKLLNGEEHMRVHVHKEDDIIALLRLRDEFNLKITIEHAGDVHTRDIFDIIKRRDIPVVYGPVDSFAYKLELKNENWRNIRHLIDSGVKYAIMSDHPVILQRNLFMQMRFLRRLGVSREECISKITRESAEILGVADLIGTIRKDMLASFTCWNGDPFSLESYPAKVYAEGKEVYSE